MSAATASTIFHEGERAVQRRAGVERVAALVGRKIASGIPAEFAAFLREQTFVVLAGRDHDGRVWASLLAGNVGFARARDDRTLRLAASLPSEDPLAAVFHRPGGQIGTSQSISTAGRGFG